MAKYIPSINRDVGLDPYESQRKTRPKISEPRIGRRDIGSQFGHNFSKDWHRGDVAECAKCWQPRFLVEGQECRKYRSPRRGR